MRHFINRDMLAPNVLTIEVDPEIVAEFRPIADTYRDDPGLVVVSPSWNSDIEWVSAANEASFGQFQSAFDRLGIAAHVEPYLDLDQAVRLYCGFLVIRSHCTAPSFHRDWDLADNEGFTLITPVTTNASEFGLLYRRMDGAVGEYRYRTGEALILGDHFLHSTKPGHSQEPVVLLSFTFGTDKMEHWENLSRTAARQSKLVRRPDGAFLHSN